MCFFYFKPRTINYDDKETPVVKKPIVKTSTVKPTVKPVTESKREIVTPLQFESKGPKLIESKTEPKELPTFNPPAVKKEISKEEIDKKDIIAPSKVKSKSSLLDFFNQNKKTERVSFGSRGNKPTNQHKGGWFNNRR